MINKRDRFEHIKSGNIYVIISTTDIKIGDKWIPGVIYTREGVEYGNL